MSPAAPPVDTPPFGLTDDLAHVAGRLRRVTVRIIHGSRGVGSGVIWRRDGVIVTNAHVISSERADVSLDDGRRLPAVLWRCDQRRDLAALRVHDDELPRRSSVTPTR